MKWRWGGEEEPNHCLQRSGHSKKHIMWNQGFDRQSNGKYHTKQRYNQHNTCPTISTIPVLQCYVLQSIHMPTFLYTHFAFQSALNGNGVMNCFRSTDHHCTPTFFTENPHFTSTAHRSGGWSVRQRSTRLPAEPQILTWLCVR